VTRLRRTFVGLGLLGVVAVAGYAAADDYAEATAFIVRAADMHGAVRTAASWEAERIQAQDLTARWRSGDLRAREYVPDDIEGRAILLVPGVHAGGIDEPRLINFAREIASAGHPVVTVELPDLIAYSITPRTTDMIEDSARWVHARWRDRMDADQRAVGMMGISFAGGLSIVAASRVGADAAWVLSFGGHGDLPRTLRYLCTGVQPDGSEFPPHDYGVVIILLGVADRLVPAEQVEVLRQGIRTFLEASHVDMVDKPKAALIFEQARTLGSGMPEPARTFMTWVNERNVARLGPALLPHVSAMGGDASLSPSRSAVPQARIYLLHGAGDNVIPAAESVLLAADLRSRGGRVEQLATALITHAEVDRPPGVAEMWKLLRFWADLL
jgi:dienelactone hydrolase